MRMRLSAAVLAAGATVAASLSAAAPGEAATLTPQYRLMLGSAQTLQYYGINGRGDIIGLGVDSAAFGREEGFVIPAGTSTPIFLGAPGDETDQGTDTQPRSINDQGVIVGTYQKNEIVNGQEAMIPRPVIWQAGSALGTDLGVNPAGDADAFAINGNGQIAGRQAGRTSITPWLLTGTAVTNLPPLKGSNDTEALGINSTGVVVGEAAVAGGTQIGGNQAALQWANGKISSLGQLGGGSWSEALAVNTAGQAVGSAAPAGSSLLNAHAVMFSGGRAVDLNVPGTTQGSAHATAINSSGVIVGDDGIDPDLVDLGNGFVYRNGHATELNTLIAPTPNVRLAGASAINDAGDIVGLAVVTAPDGSETSVGYELVPIA